MDTSTSKIVGVFYVCIMLFIVAVTTTGCSSPLSESKQGKGASLSDLTIKTSTTEHSFKVELALDDRAQARGLMFRRAMLPDHGMLFIYKSEHPISMWMKNTVLSLDMLFVKNDGTIVKIAKRTEPFSERVISSNGPVLGVLELNGGTAERLSISVGDRLIHSLLRAP